LRAQSAVTHHYRDHVLLVVAFNIPSLTIASHRHEGTNPCTTPPAVEPSTPHHTPSFSKVPRCTERKHNFLEPCSYSPAYNLFIPPANPSAGLATVHPQDHRVASHRLTVIHSFHFFSPLGRKNYVRIIIMMDPSVGVCKLKSAPIFCDCAPFSLARRFRPFCACQRASISRGLRAANRERYRFLTN
jgi:hypothetical protein